MSSRTYTEEEIQDLTDRVFLLREKIEAGQIKFAAHLVEDFKRSFEAIRLRSDGKVDPATVDGRIRASTLAISAIKQREDAKKDISLAQIQDAYFTLLFRQFGWFYDQMKEAGVTPAHLAEFAATKEDLVKQITEALPDLTKQLSEFWDLVGDAAGYHLQDNRQLKATFAGDIFPAHWENAVSTAGIYIDTIILPCPITKIAPLQGNIPPRQLVSLLLKHTLTAMSYRDLAIADVSPPIALVVPNPDDVNPENRKSFVSRAEPFISKHASYLFGRPFDSIEHLQDFCDHLLTIEQVLRELKGGDRLLFDAEWDRDPEKQLSRVMAERNPIVPGMDSSKAGHHVFATCLGRMPQAIGAQENAFHFGASPLISAETSWLYYTWLLEYEGNPANDDESTRQSLHVARALVSESGSNLQWLGNVPTETVLQIRKLGLAEELRQLLGQGVADLIKIHPGNYFRTADQVVENLDRAFREHQKKLIEAKQKKLKLYGIDVASCVAVGGIAVAAALTSNPQLGALSGVLGVAGLPNLKEIKTKFSQISAEDRARRNSPTGLLFQHIKS